MLTTTALVGARAKRYERIGWLLDDFFPDAEFSVVEVGPTDAMALALWPSRIMYLGLDDFTGHRDFHPRQPVVKSNLRDAPLPTNRNAVVCANYKRHRSMSDLMTLAVRTVQQSIGVLIVHVPEHIVARTVDLANRFFAKVAVFSKGGVSVVACRLPRSNQ